MRMRPGPLTKKILLFSLYGSLFAGAVIFIAGLVVWRGLPDYGAIYKKNKAGTNLIVVDRRGKLMRIMPDAKQQFTLSAGVEDIPECMQKAIIAAEDKRFYSHWGFDPIAIGRAIRRNLSRTKIVSGASTISQQVIRLLDPRPRTFRTKFVELVAAVKMEHELSKSQILELYLNSAPMGGNIKGVALASRVFFGKDISKINTSEAALLAALPRAPKKWDLRSPTGRQAAMAERNRILDRMWNLGWLSPNEFRFGKAENFADFSYRPLPLEAPHFTEMVVNQAKESAGVIKTTLDLRLQHVIEQIVKGQAGRIEKSGASQIGVVVVDLKSAETSALVGSAKYSHEHSGFVNAVTATRGAGSILKPFLYGMALEKGYQPFTEIADTFQPYRTPHGDYQPFNADRRWYGPVTIRTALGNSLNIPAVKMLKTLGVDEFYSVLERLDLTGDETDPEKYGLGLAIGNMEVDLFNLVQAYTVFGNKGLLRRLRMTDKDQPRESVIFEPETAYLISNILSDPSARLLMFGNPSYFEFGFPVALKTGTSSKYRDCWMVAYTSEHVIGIWAGNFSGKPVGQGLGAQLAGPVMKQIIDTLYGSGPPPSFAKPATLKEISICWLSGKKAGPNCPYRIREFSSGSDDPPVCELTHSKDEFMVGGEYAQWLNHRELEQGAGRFQLSLPGPELPTSSRSIRVRKSPIEIVSPHDRDRFVHSSRDDNQILLRAVPDPAVEHVIWYVNGIEIARTPPPYEMSWQLTRGRHVIQASTPENYAARVTILVE